MIDASAKALLISEEQKCAGDWQEALRTAYSSADELVAAGFSLPQEVTGAEEQFLFRVPKSYAELFDRQNLAHCPLFRQALPTAFERDPILPPWAVALSQRGCGRDAPWQSDPIGDVSCLAAPRLTHRYAHRAILHTSFACALYCRFCFRKHAMSSREPALYRGPFAPALLYLQSHKEISEVILTGGDPLSLSDKALEQLLIEIAQIMHVRVVRLHSRMLGVLPERITSRLLELFLRIKRIAGQQIVLVAHIVHPKELTALAARALKNLVDIGVVTMHQMVLMRGINNDVDTLFKLYSRLYNLGCLAHYLHHPDWTPNTFGFRVSIDEGRELVSQLEGRLSGPARPTYVLDVPGGFGKVPLCNWRVRRVEEAGAKGRDARLKGQLWQVEVPHTRRGKTKEARTYVDLSFI